MFPSGDSVKLKMKKLTYIFDIDGTICTDTKGKYEEAIPYLERIDRINQLYDNGHHIFFFTSRGSCTGIDWKDLTKQQLVKWGAKYHELIFGKPSYDLFICDKAINSKVFFERRN